MTPRGPVKARISWRNAFRPGLTVKDTAPECVYRIGLAGCKKDGPSRWDLLTDDLGKGYVYLGHFVERWVPMWVKGSGEGRRNRKCMDVAERKGRGNKIETPMITNTAATLAQWRVRLPSLSVYTPSRLHLDLVRLLHAAAPVPSHHENRGEMIKIPAIVTKVVNFEMLVPYAAPNSSRYQLMNSTYNGKRETMIERENNILGQRGKESEALQHTYVRPSTRKLEGPRLEDMTLKGSPNDEGIWIWMAGRQRLCTADWQVRAAEGGFVNFAILSRSPLAVHGGKGKAQRTFRPGPPGIQGKERGPRLALATSWSSASLRGTEESAVRERGALTRANLILDATGGLEVQPNPSVVQRVEALQYRQTACGAWIGEEEGRSGARRWGEEKEIADADDQHARDHTAQPNNAHGPISLIRTRDLAAHKCTISSWIGITQHHADRASMSDRNHNSSNLRPRTQDEHKQNASRTYTRTRGRVCMQHMGHPSRKYQAGQSSTKLDYQPPPTFVNPHRLDPVSPDIGGIPRFW
ncbi:hypothetical protein C8R47DRAFT_1063024 [Mycena vitilis]|nr:hypothetical protein C8R47DRAFT_1063024 [Mycena vitilis]